MDTMSGQSKMNKGMKQNRLTKNNTTKDGGHPNVLVCVRQASVAL